MWELLYEGEMDVDAIRSDTKEDVMYRIVERVREKIPDGVREPIEFRMALFALLSHVDHHIPLTDGALCQLYANMLSVRGGNYARMIRMLTAIDMERVPIALRTVRVPKHKHNFRHALDSNGRDMLNL